jgi:predicted transcriptional regulator of viral defense system
MKVETFFARHPVFARDEFNAFCGGQGECNHRTLDVLLAYHVSVGHLLRVRRGLYAVVPTGMDPAAAPVDAYLVASRMTADAVLAYHTAVDLHGRAYSVYETLFFLTEHRCRPSVFRSLRFNPVMPPKRLRDLGAADFGVTVVDRSGLDVRVTTLERTLVDVLDRPDLGGGWEEVWRSLESVEYFNLEAVVEYTRLLGSATTAAKVGFFLEQHQDTLMVDAKYLVQLREYAPRQPHYMDRTDNGRGVLVSAWNLIVPAAVVNRAWEEVL